MIKTLTGFLLLLLCSSAQAQTQIFDDFEDGSITSTTASSSTPASLVWGGNVNLFQVNTTAPVLAGSYSIRSATADVPAAISTTVPSGITFANSNLTWRFLYRNNNNVTVASNDAPAIGANSWRIWLAATTNSRTTASGYVLAQKGSQLLLRAVTTTIGTTTTSTYSDIASCTIAGAKTYSVRVTRRSDGLWALFVDEGTGEAVTSYGGGGNTAVSMPSTYYTMFDSNNILATNSNGFIWDNYRISRTYLQVDCNDNSVQATNIFSGDTNKALFSFRLTATENVPLKFIYISSSYNNLNDGKIRNNTARLIQSDDNDFATTTDNVDVTAQFDQAIVESNAIKFYSNATNGFLVPNGSSKYYFVVVDMNAQFTGTGTPPPTTFSTSSSNANFNATAGTFQFSANNQVATNGYNCSKTQTFSGLYDWIGSNSAAWEINANWLVGGSAPAYPPGQYDVVRIGVNSGITITNQPLVADTRFCSAIIFGPQQNNILTVNGSLTATGDLTANHGNTATASSGGMPAATPTFKTTLAGTGTLTVGLAILGDNTFPASNATNLIATELSVEIANMNVKKDIVLVANIIDNTYGVNAPQFLHRKGTLTLTGQFDRKINGIYPVPYPNKKDSQVGYFTTDHNTGNIGDTRLILENLNAIKSQVDGIGVDFTNNGNGISTTVYRNNTTSVQTVYPENNSANSIAIGEANSNYENIEFEGTGPKQFFLNGYSTSLPITIGGNWISSGGKVDLTTINTTIQFQGGNQTLADNGSDNGLGVVFKNVRFTNSGVKTIQTGNFAVTPAGTLAMANTARLAADGKLTLKSSISASATVLPIPAGASISGNVNVERYVQGSSTDLSKRGYRLLSSPVYTASPNIGDVAVRTSDPNYLLNSAFVSGIAGNGFNVSGNPSLYIYREDLVPTGTTFTSSNYKGIASLSTSSPFAVRTQTRLNTGYTADTTVNLPVGTGFLFFFRGDKSNNSTATGTKTTAPFDFPEDVVFTSTGTLNQGTVNVRSWYAQPDQTKLSYTTTIANNISPRNVRGYHLLGNPYPSSINWNKANRNGTNSSIYGSNIDGPTVWFFNPTNKQYASYLPAAGVDTLNTLVLQGTNGASNIIASGQGFFVRANAAGGTFRFMEAAKTTFQPPAASLNKLMGIPVSTVVGVQPYMRIQLKKDSLNDDDILLRFDGAYSEDFLTSEDAEDLGGNGAILSLSALSGDKKTKISIDGVPDFTRIKKVPLFVDAITSGLYELHRKEFVGAADVYQVWLKDNFTRDSLDFRQNALYTFRIDRSKPATYGENRFELIFRKKPMPPYELLSFTAEKVKEGALLKWKVLNEYAYTQFTIQKSDGSHEFIPLNKMQSDGAGNYTYLDTKYSGEISSYRILQNKPDGTESFSAIATLKNNSQKPFMIYPNPAPDYLIVELDAVTTAKLRVTDSKGSIIRGTIFTGKSTRLSIGNLKAGVYTIEVSDTSSFKLLGREKWIKL